MNFNRIGAWTLAILIAGFLPSPTSGAFQDKLTVEIAGDYDLDVGGRILPFKILLKEAKLFFDAQVEGLEPQVMTPVPGKDLTFTSTDPNGDEVIFAFVKDPQGKIMGCAIFVSSRNAEAKAVKVERK